MIYFEIPNFIIKRIYIVKENNKLVYKKLVDNQYISLNEQEIKELEKYLNRNNSSIYYSERKDMPAENNDIAAKMDNYLYIFFEYLGTKVPKNCHNNFYTNFPTLKINFNLQVLDESITTEEKDDFMAGYDVEHNAIFSDPDSIRQYRLMAQSMPNPDEFLWSNISHDLIHELFHMASSKYFGEGQGFVCGFDKYPANNYERNRGLTEGFTEYLANACVPNTKEIPCNYFVEEMLVNQLILIVGKNVMIESYFNNLGIKEIAKKLCEFAPDFDEALFLFELIEINFNLDKDSPRNILAGIEMRLLNYFKIKIEKDILNNVSKEEILKSIEEYKSYLVTREILNIHQENTPKYNDIEIVIDDFNQFTKNIMEKLASRNI